MPSLPIKPIPFALGLVAFAALAFLDSPLRDFGEYGALPALAAGVTAWMAIWWIGEAAPLWLTALIPLALYPFTRVHGDGFGVNLLGALLPYLDPYIFLFLGGMGIAAAMQQWNLHRRVALAIMRRVGTAPRRLLLGVLASTALVSLWISNTATAAMMLPIGLAVLRELERQAGRRLAGFGCAMMLAIAYGANVGGMGTKIGTVPNAQLAGFLVQERGVDVSFLGFMAIGLPFVIAFVPVLWLALWRVGRRDAPAQAVGEAALASEARALGPLQRAERAVMVVFVAAAALWIAGKPITDWLKLQVTAFKLGSSHVEAAIALSASLALILWRVRGERVLAPRSFRLLQWEALVLLGGGFSMAAAVEASGLSAWLGGQLTALREFPAFAQVALASLATVTLSAFASNVATTAVMLPILVSSVSPEHTNVALVSAALASSCDFALPAGTPPNAIVFGSGYVKVPVMARTGAALDVLAALIVSAWCWWIVPRVIG
ncbi:MAG: SLC13/DASS family transporter [Deltaproteobacteria bacterium]|nr:SLC13/DASS family transporter [Deltaproteobacteria bacterium]